MAKVTAKVIVNHVTRSDEQGQSQVGMIADYNDGANKEWSKYTPALSVTMTVKNEVADTHFKQGTKLTLTFEEEN